MTVGYENFFLSNLRRSGILGTIEQMLDYVKHTPADGLTSHHCVQQRKKLIDKYFESRSKK